MAEAMEGERSKPMMLPRELTCDKDASRGDATELVTDVVLLSAKSITEEEFERNMFCCCCCCCCTLDNKSFEGWPLDFSC